MTEIPLREHIENQIKWLDRHVAEQLRAIEEAITKREIELDRRLETMNDFRNTLKDQALGFATRTEMESRFKTIDQRMLSFERSRAYALGATSIISAIIAAIVAWIIR